MPTQTVYLTGTVKWAKVRTPDEKYNDYKINLYPDKNSLNLIKESGVQVQPKEDEDGTYYTFRRKHEQLIKRELKTWGPPKVLKSDNTEFEGLIGNGSGITAKVSVFDTIKGKGHRLEIVRVDSLIEYIPDNVDTGMPPAPTSPPPGGSPKASAKAAVKPPF